MQDARLIPHFSGNEHINDVLRTIGPGGRRRQRAVDHRYLWTAKETDAHLVDLADRGVKIFWFDHHRTALKRYTAGDINVPFTAHVVSEEFSAARIVYQYLEEQLAPNASTSSRLSSAVAMADDNDRWIHAIPGSRELAWTIRTMGARTKLGRMCTADIDANVTYTPSMRGLCQNSKRNWRALP